MKLVGLGAGILFLVFVALHLLFVSFAFLWAIMGESAYDDAQRYYGDLNVAARFAK